MPVIHLTLLGGFSAIGTADSPLPLPGKAKALVAYLAARPGTAHQRDKLAALLWADSSDARARDSLRHAIGAIRRAWSAGGAPDLVIDDDTFALAPRSVASDTLTFERFATERQPASWRAAVDLYRGDLLEGVVVDAPLFEEWLLTERERLREIAVQTLARLLAAHLAEPPSHESQTEAIAIARRLLALDPLQEPVHRTLMRVYLAHGQRAAALRHYRLCIDTLQREVGADPEIETRQLYEEIVRRGSDVPARAALKDSAHSDAAVVLPSLVGRDVETAALRRAIDEARQGAGRVVLLAGDEGVGKTAMLAAFQAMLGDGGFTVLTARAHASTQILSFGLWVDALRNAGLTRDDAALVSLDPVWRAELGRLLPEVGEGVPLPPGDVLRVFESVARIVGALERTGPIAILLDDVHWADEMSLRLLPYVARAVAGTRVVLGAALRTRERTALPVMPEVVAELRRVDGTSSVELGPLTRADIASLTARWTRVGTPPDAIDRLSGEVWALSRGDPHLALEFLRAVREGAAPDTGSTASTPDRVHGLLAARFGRLSERTRRVLAVAATLGVAFEFALLRDASEMSSHDAAEAVEELARRGIVEGAGEGFDFTHDRLREVAYRMIAPERAVLLHGIVARSIETVYPGQVERFAAQLGQHYERAGDLVTAAMWFERAARVLIVRSAYRDAAGLIERGLSALARAADGQAVATREIDLLLALRTLSLVGGDFGRALDCLQRAQPLAERIGDDARLARVLSYMTQSVWLTGGYPVARAHGERAVALAGRANDTGVQAEAAFFLGSTCVCGGDYPRALEVLSSSAAMLQGPLAVERFDLPFVPSCGLRSWLAWALADVGRFDEALEEAGRVTAIAAAIRDPFSTVVAGFTTGLVLVRSGRPHEAVPMLAEALEGARRAQIQVLLPYVAGHLGLALARAGQPEAGIEVLQQVIEQSMALQLVAYLSRWTSMLGEACLLADRLDDAGQHAQQALDLARRYGERSNEAWALWLLGRLASRGAGRTSPPVPVDPAALLAQAHSLAGELRMAPFPHDS